MKQTPLEAIYLEGYPLRVQAYRTLMRAGITTVEELIGRDVYLTRTAEGPSPFAEDDWGVPIRTGAEANAWAQWMDYRHRYGLAELKNIGPRALHQLSIIREEMIERWRTRTELERVAPAKEWSFD